MIVNDEMECQLEQARITRVIKCKHRYKMQISIIHNKMHSRTFNSSF